MRLILHQHSIKFQIKLDSLQPVRKVENIYPRRGPRPGSLPSGRGQRPDRPAFSKSENVDRSARVSLPCPTWLPIHLATRAKTAMPTFFLSGLTNMDQKPAPATRRNQFIAEQETHSL